ncbi:MAG: bifunctional DNA primase/polymerase [Candidatus Nanohaloarchaea archaeon]
MTDLRPGQLLRLHERIMETAPEDYTPYYFPVQEEGKAPDVRGSWKNEEMSLTIAEAKKRLQQNIGNVGIAGRPGDRLLLLDIDDPELVDELKDTLMVRSRSRGTKEKPALHAIYWADPDDDNLPANIPTEKGELRGDDQYVVTPGSHVPIPDEEIREKVEVGEFPEEALEQIPEDPFRGYYTIHRDRPVAELEFDELPQVFQDNYRERTRRTAEAKTSVDREFDSTNSSALFKLQITDLTDQGLTGRDPHPLHPSSTGANWSISSPEDSDSKIGHCWRHTVSLNALQFLTVEAGLWTCLEAGTPHKNCSAGPSKVKNDDRSIWAAWKHAKENGYIPKDDPIPTRAMKHIARNHDIYDAEPGEMLPAKAYNQVLQVVEEEY